MICPELAWPELNVTGACCCRPAVTFRPAGSLVVVSVTLTLSPAANAGWAESTPPARSPMLANRQPHRRTCRRPEERIRTVAMAALPFKRDAGLTAGAIRSKLGGI